MIGRKTTPEDIVLSPCNAVKRLGNIEILFIYIFCSLTADRTSIGLNKIKTMLILFYLTAKHDVYTKINLELHHIFRLLQLPFYLISF